MSYTKIKFYESPYVTTDSVIFSVENKELKVLLIKRANSPFKGQWALPGVFLMKKESTKDAAIRALNEKAGTDVSYLEQLFTFDSAYRDPRGHIISIVYFGLISRDKLVIKKQNSSVALFSVNKLPLLVFDHLSIIHYAVSRLQAKLEYTNVVFSLLPKYFTLGQLQAIYEIILKQKFDKRNFRKKFLSLRLIKPTRKYSEGGRQRPAVLYEFASHKPQELKKFF